ncbi:hypothetical protein NL676_031649 [Syzygium grande]|nr:hypothetical protein NL676_031649 [Syzygium grande]
MCIPRSFPLLLPRSVPNLRAWVLRRSGFERDFEYGERVVFPELHFAAECALCLAPTARVLEIWFSLSGFLLCWGCSMCGQLFLSQCFLHTLSPFPAPCRQAESSLADAADCPIYALAVLRLVAEPSVDEQIRQAAAINFKNHLRARWVSSPSPHDAAGADAKAA